VRWAELTVTGDTVVLSVGIRWELDALGLARLLATRFPALRIAGVFVAEQDLFAFDALAFADGKLVYDAQFIDEFSFAVPGEARHHGVFFRHGVFFERTPDRSQAAREHLSPAALAALAAQRPAVAPDGAGRRRTPRDASPTASPVPRTPPAAPWSWTATASPCCTTSTPTAATDAPSRSIPQPSGHACPNPPKREAFAAAATAIERHRQEHAADLAAIRQRIQRNGDDEEAPSSGTRSASWPPPPSTTSPSQPSSPAWSPR